MDTLTRYDFKFHTFGCKVNTYDTGLLEQRLKPRMLEVSLEAEPGSRALARVHVLNTCAVTAEATVEATKLVRRLKSREPLSTIVVTGCGAQVDGEIFDHLPGADLVVANSHKGQLEEILDQHFKGTAKSRVFRSNIFRKDDLEAGGGIEASHTRAFLKIQDGCNSFCTYCVIPFARGKSRSLAIDHLTMRVRELTEKLNFSEVVLTGVHIGDYEDPSAGAKRGLEDLIETLLSETSVSRLRLTSLEPVELTPRLLALFKNPRLCPHFHMSIQSANSRILKAMKRQYTADDVEFALGQIAQSVPQAFVGMDVIAGFPGESEDEFEDTYRRLERLPWTRLHVFPYSNRPGTKASLLVSQLDDKVKTMRALRLRQLSSDRFKASAARQVGQEKHALLLERHLTEKDLADRQKMPQIEALTRDYWPLKIVRTGGSGLSLEDYLRLRAKSGREIKVRVLAVDRPTVGRMDARLLACALEND